MSTVITTRGIIQWGKAWRKVVDSVVMDSRNGGCKFNHRCYLTDVISWRVIRGKERGCNRCALHNLISPRFVTWRDRAWMGEEIKCYRSTRY